MSPLSIATQGLLSRRRQSLAVALGGLLALSTAGTAVVLTNTDSTATGRRSTTSATLYACSAVVEFTRPSVVTDVASVNRTAILSTVDTTKELYATYKSAELSAVDLKASVLGTSKTEQLSAVSRTDKLSVASFT